MSMNISPQVRAIAELLSTYARNGLHDARMMERFLQQAEDRGTPAVLGELAFHAKFLTRVEATIRQQTPESELYAKLEQEFSNAVHEFHGRVKDFIEDAEPGFRSLVEKQYLTVSEQSLRNLMQLAQDFTCLKNWELEMTQGTAGTPGDTEPSPEKD